MERKRSAAAEARRAAKRAALAPTGTGTGTTHLNDAARAVRAAKGRPSRGHGEAGGAAGGAAAAPAPPRACTSPVPSSRAPDRPARAPRRPETRGAPHARLRSGPRRRRPGAHKPTTRRSAHGAARAFKEDPSSPGRRPRARRAPTPDARKAAKRRRAEGRAGGRVQKRTRRAAGGRGRGGRGRGGGGRWRGRGGGTHTGLLLDETRLRAKVRARLGGAASQNTPKYDDDAGARNVASHRSPPAPTAPFEVALRPPDAELSPSRPSSRRLWARLIDGKREPCEVSCADFDDVI